MRFLPPKNCGNFVFGLLPWLLHMAAFSRPPFAFSRSCFSFSLSVRTVIVYLRQCKSNKWALLAVLISGLPGTWQARAQTKDSGNELAVPAAGKRSELESQWPGINQLESLPRRIPDYDLIPTDLSATALPAPSQLVHPSIYYINIWFAHLFLKSPRSMQFALFCLMDCLPFASLSGSVWIHFWVWSVQVLERVLINAKPFGSRLSILNSLADPVCLSLFWVAIWPF